MRSHLLSNREHGTGRFGQDPARNRAKCWQSLSKAPCAERNQVNLLATDEVYQGFGNRAAGHPGFEWNACNRVLVQKDRHFLLYGVTLAVSGTQRSFISFR